MLDPHLTHVLIPEEIGAHWRRLPDDVVLHFCAGDPAALDAAISNEIEIIVTDPMPTPESAHRWDGIRWVQLMSAGTDQTIGHPLRRDGVTFSSAAGITAVHIAEFALGRVLAHTRRFEHFFDDQRSRLWGDRVALAGPSLRGLRAVIVGYGGVGRETARLFVAAGIDVTAVTRDGLRRPYQGFVPYPGFGDELARLPADVVATDDLVNVVSNADILILAVPLNPETNRLIDASILAACKPGAILINVARGAVVDTSALLHALDHGNLDHAYLDVFETEPLPRSSTLWDHPRISITPHMAGVLPDTASKLEELFLVNLIRFRSGSRLINQLR